MEIDIKEPLLEAIKAFGEYIDEIVTTPAYSKLFIIQQTSKATRLVKERILPFSSGKDIL